MFEVLKTLRKEKNITANTMAEILGLETTSAYTKKENGSVKFTLYEAKAISDYFHMPIEKIFFENEVSR
jgi:putative transcriptional regulator